MLNTLILSYMERHFSLYAIPFRSRKRKKRHWKKCPTCWQKWRSRNQLQNSYFKRISSLDVMEFKGPVKKVSQKHVL